MGYSDSEQGLLSHTLQVAPPPLLVQEPLPGTHPTAAPHRLGEAGVHLSCPPGRRGCQGPDRGVRSPHEASTGPGAEPRPERSAPPEPHSAPLTTVHKGYPMRNGYPLRCGLARPSCSNLCSLAEATATQKQPGAGRRATLWGLGRESRAESKDTGKSAQGSRVEHQLEHPWSAAHERRESPGPTC